MLQTNSWDSGFDFISELERTSKVVDDWFQKTCCMGGAGVSQDGINFGFSTPKPILIWTVPEWVREKYLEGVLPDENCGQLNICNHSTPYFYGDEFWSSGEIMPAQRQLYDEQIASVSMRSMISVPVHSAAKKYPGLFVYSCNFSGEAFDDMSAECGSEMHLVGLTLVNDIRALVRKHDSARAGLTSRERECLLWLSRGLRNDQISKRIGIRPVTVEFHLANARQKLGAKTREQALVKAIQLNMIQP